MFLHMSVCLQGGGILACIAGGIPACPAAGFQGGWWFPSMPCRFPGPHPWGKLRGLARGVSRSTPGRGVSRPTPGRGVSRPTPRRGLQAHTRGGVCVPACTEADPPDGYCCGQFASYWNAFLLLFTYAFIILTLFWETTLNLIAMMT